MEDIYEDLSNYEDVHALEELRAENKELKVKLEEHSAAMEKLQKEILQDYDTLQTAFKQLENNYSSLLMTARAELQRKTQRITQLSQEKDVMILDAFSSGRNIRRNFNRGGNNPGRGMQDRPVKGNNRTKQDNVDIKPKSHEPRVKSAKDAGPDSGTSKSSKSSKAAVIQLESSNIGKNNVNDNIAEHKTEVNECPKTSASSIKDRRKSVPAVSMPIDTFSSRNELERNYPTKEIRTDNERKNINKLPIERPSNKTSEAFGVDDRSHKYHESSSGDNYRSRSIKQHDSSSYRGRDKHEVSLKYRKQYSPERYPKQRENLDAHSKQHRQYSDDYTKKYREHADYYPEKRRELPGDYPKQHRDHSDDYPKHRRELPDNYPEKRWERPDDSKRRSDHPDDIHKHERGRYQGRSLESPPQSHNRRQRTKSVHQSDHDRYPHEPELNRNNCDDKYSAKYRSKENDGPPIKRQRTESYGNPDTYSMDDKRHNRAMDSDEGYTPDFSPHEYDMVRPSCQSPDSVHIEGAIAYPTKEIMATASTPLDDPRVTSKRYVIWKEFGKETLSTVVGRNIDIIPVNKAVWNIKPVDVPVALVRRPSQCSDQLVKDIYMDIENPVTNLDASMESGEVCGTDDEFHEIPSKLKEIQHNTQDLKISKQTPEDISKQPVNAETVSKPNIAKYRIPKIGLMTKNTQSKKDVPIIELGETIPQHKNVIKNGAAEDTVPKELLTQKEQNNKHEDFFHNNKKSSKVDGNKKSKSRERVEHQSTLTQMAIVADDLELSDDNSDHMDTGKNKVPEKVQKICGKSLNMNEGRSNESVNNVEKKTVSVNNVENKTVSPHNTDIKNTVETTGLKDVAEEDKTKESDSAKKQKAKKKKSKSKDSAEYTADSIHVPEKKPKAKKEKESTLKETKEKFCDLFGDSSSLMTPEDLGIPSYLPISEDAQDAVDMKINQIIDASPLVDKGEIPGEMLPRNKVEVTIQKTVGHVDIPNADLQKTDIEDKEAVHEFKKKASKRNEEIIDINQLPSPIVYENLNPGTPLNDPNVVKTVIISTGKQPENKIQVSKPDKVVKVSEIQNTNEMNIFPATMELKKDILRALATSTPHKEYSALNPPEADTVKTDIICDPCVSKAVATITNVEPVVSQTEKITLESNDTPDIRIFVKRRRKVVKRPPMT